MENWGNQCAQLLLGLLTQRQTVESGRLRQEHLNAWACLFGWFYITLRHWRSARYPYRKAISFICTVFYFVDKWHSGLQVHALSMLVLVGLGLSSRKLLQWACKLSCEPPSCLQKDFSKVPISLAESNLRRTRLFSTILMTIRAAEDLASAL